MRIWKLSYWYTNSRPLLPTAEKFPDSTALVRLNA